jgi:hypothetical protein
MAELILKLVRDVERWRKVSGQAAGKYRMMPWNIQKKKDFLGQIAHRRYKIKDIGHEGLYGQWAVKQGIVKKAEFVPRGDILLKRARKAVVSAKSSLAPNKKDLTFLERQDKKYGMLRNMEDPTYDAYSELGVLGEALKKMGR